MKLLSFCKILYLNVLIYVIISVEYVITKAGDSLPAQYIGSLYGKFAQFPKRPTLFSLPVR